MISSLKFAAIISKHCSRSFMDAFLSRGLYEHSRSSATQALTARLDAEYIMC
jgi:hypothetical protein